MSEGYGTFDSNRIKHMEMIESTVARLANNSFLVKGWAVTVAGAFFGFSVSRNESKLAAAGILPVLFFWELDAYFMFAERLFRALYDRVRQGDSTVAPFFMGATSPDFVERLRATGGERISWQGTLWRPTLMTFYGALLLAGFLISVLIPTT